VRQRARPDRARRHPSPSHVTQLDVSALLEEQDLDRMAPGGERDLAADLARAVQASLSTTRTSPIRSVLPSSDRVANV
jgi:hypothetical protein